MRNFDKVSARLIFLTKVLQHSCRKSYETSSFFLSHEAMSIFLGLKSPKFSTFLGYSSTCHV